MYFYVIKYFGALRNLPRQKRKEWSMGFWKMKGFCSALYFRRGICLKIIPYHCSRIDIGLEIRHMPEKEKIIIGTPEGINRWNSSVVLGGDWLIKPGKRVQAMESSKLSDGRSPGNKGAGPCKSVSLPDPFTLPVFQTDAGSAVRSCGAVPRSSAQTLYKTARVGNFGKWTRGISSHSSSISKQIPS